MSKRKEWPRCYTWAEVKDHKLMAGRFVTEKDFAWVLLASIPECTVVDVETKGPGYVTFTVNRETSTTEVLEILESRRPVNVKMRVRHFE